MVAASAVLALMLPSFSSSAEVAAPPEPCTLDPGPSRTVARVLDGETLTLDDGSVVRLIGALAPRARDAGAATGTWPPENEAIKALSDLVLGKKVKLAFGGRHSDRYGRLLANVFLEGSGGAWVQGALLAGGHARAYGLSGSFVCSRELLTHEAEARRQHLGLWENGVYGTLAASRPAELMKRRGKYERVIGNVTTVGRTKSATYLNFGTDWHSDFTARIDKTVIAANPDFAARLDGLASKTVTVRGWIERRNGPLIDVADPSQIEVLESDTEHAPAVSEHRVPQSQEVEPAHAPAGAPPDRGSPKNARPAPLEGTEPGAVNL